MRSLLSRLGLGRLWLILYHGPRSRLRDWRWTGGARGREEMARAQVEWEAAALALPPCRDNPPDALSPVWLTGRKHWFQALFCAHTLWRQSGRAVRPQFVSDGTIDAEIAARLRTVFPHAVIHDHATIEARLNTLLPASRFPTLRERRGPYPHIRKLTDVHVGARGYQLVLDSDMLFFHPPTELVAWAAAPSGALCLQERIESYGYSRALLEEVCGAPLPVRLNVGICGLPSEQIDWDEIERWAATLVARAKASYFLEQALVAMWVARHGGRMLATERYLTLPTPAEMETPTAALLHYVADARRYYFTTAWRQAVPRA